ncbi:MAG: DMT family transporter [Puniceicoccales bacterium]|jgi:S-adenosylmethionine uptake transporter|nr:DMT family transporter [Puniceicoccales bacterium]
MHKPLTKGVSWFLLSLIVGVGLDVIQKYLGSNLKSFEITFYRFLFGAISLMPLLGMRWIRHGFSLTQYWHIHIFRGFLLFSGMVLWCYGLTLVPMSTAITLNYSIPLFTLILSIPLLGETVNKDRWLTTCIGFVGIWIVLNPTDINFDSRTLLLIISSFLFALLDVFNKKYVCKESLLNMLFYTALFTCIFSAIPAFSGEIHTPFNNITILIMLGIGANLMFYCLLKAFQYMDASASAPFRYCDFLVSALFGFLFFSEKPTLSTCLGFLIIMPCTCYLAYQENKKN